MIDSLRDLGTDYFDPDFTKLLVYIHGREMNLQKVAAHNRFLNDGFCRKLGNETEAVDYATQFRANGFNIFVWWWAQYSWSPAHRGELRESGWYFFSDEGNIGTEVSPKIWADDYIRQNGKSFYGGEKGNPLWAKFSNASLCLGKTGWECKMEHSEVFEWTKTETDKDDLDPDLAVGNTFAESLLAIAPSLSSVDTFHLVGNSYGSQIALHGTYLVLSKAGLLQQSQSCQTAKKADLSGVTSVVMLKNVRSGYYLHVSNEHMENGNQLLHYDSTSDGSKWVVEHVDNSASIVMLRSIRSGYYLHVGSNAMKNGDPVYHYASSSDGSKWQIEPVDNSGSTVMLKSVRSGYYLHVSDKQMNNGDPVLQYDSASDGSKWQIESQIESHQITTTYNGWCRYGSKEKDLIGNHRFPGSASSCGQECYSESGCTAYAFDSGTRECFLYKGGPYTHGSGRENTLCYVPPARRAFQSCQGKIEGEQCKLCDPSDTGCIETAVVKTCQAGECKAAPSSSPSPSPTVLVPTRLVLVDPVYKIGSVDCGWKGFCWNDPIFALAREQLKAIHDYGVPTLKLDATALSNAMVGTVDTGPLSYNAATVHIQMYPNTFLSLWMNVDMHTESVDWYFRTYFPNFADADPPSPGSSCPDQPGGLPIAFGCTSDSDATLGFDKMVSGENGGVWGVSVFRQSDVNPYAWKAKWGGEAYCTAHWFWGLMPWSGCDESKRGRPCRPVPMVR